MKFVVIDTITMRQVAQFVHYSDAHAFVLWSDPRQDRLTIQDL